ncbi:MAG: lipoyl(octanoyl) transferase LipB [Caulobacteraceae bacterium]
MLDRSLNPNALLRPDETPSGWAVSAGLVGYLEAEAAMEARVAAIAEGEGGELVWLVQHPPLYTAGVSAKPGDLLDPGRFPVFRSGRGGQFTYHGPGQRVAYVMLDLTTRGRDVRAFVRALQTWIVEALARLGAAGEVREGRVGVWVERGGGREDKVAAIGVKVRRWVSFHGVSLNVDPDLGHFGGIVPCGVTDHGVTSLSDLGLAVSMSEVDAALKHAFGSVFGPVVEAAAPIP